MRPALLLLAALTCLAPNRAAVAQSAPQQGRPYYIEYRGRTGGVLGHAYITYGRLDGRGRPAETRYAGFYPRDDYEEALMTFGPLVAAPAYIGVDKKDRVTPPSAVYRRNLTAREYAHLQFVLRQMRMSRLIWHLAFNNCNDFVGQVAKEMGLVIPPAWDPPNLYINGLRALNGPSP
jgi:hypothetical protein